jgi:YVTN family beta-propeller protein
MGLALAASGPTLYVSGGRGKTLHVVSLEGEAPRVARALTDVGARPWGIGLSRDGKKLFTANGPSGDVSVIDTVAGRVTGRIQVGGSPWGIAVR